MKQFLEITFTVIILSFTVLTVKWIRQNNMQPLVIVTNTVQSLNDGKISNQENTIRYDPREKTISLNGDVYKIDKSKRTYSTKDGLAIVVKVKSDDTKIFNLYQKDQSFIQLTADNLYEYSTK